MSILTTAEVANLLRVSKATVSKLLQSGEIPAIRVGRQWRVQATDLAQYLKQTNKD